MNEWMNKFVKMKIESKSIFLKKGWEREFITEKERRKVLWEKEIKREKGGRGNEQNNE